MDRSRHEVLILGAGLTGVSIALELSHRGIASTLIERDPLAVHRASLRNEGKIHLGLIYANDPSLTTALRQLEGALSFRALISRWLVSDEWLARSAPFHYLVARSSILGPERLAEHYAAVERHCRALLADPGRDYLGARPGRLTRRLEDAEIERFFDRDHFVAGFATEECAVDTDRLAFALRVAVGRDARIRFMPSHQVRAVEPRGDSFLVAGDGPVGSFAATATHLVNATWEQRVGFDRQLWLAPPAHLLHRLKFRVIARLPEHLRAAPSVTMVLGRYGDLVVRSNGTAYLSWYPVAMRGWSEELVPPSFWDAFCRGEVDADLRAEIVAAVLSGMNAWCPGLAACEPICVDAGVVVAIGATDVDDRSSELHDRSRIGVFSRGRYHSVDPGKLTTAPLFAIEAADRIERERAGHS